MNYIKKHCCGSRSEAIRPLDTDTGYLFRDPWSTRFQPTWFLKIFKKISLESILMPVKKYKKFNFVKCRVVIESNIRDQWWEKNQDPGSGINIQDCNTTIKAVLRIRAQDPVPFRPLDPGFGIPVGFSGSQIPDPKPIFLGAERKFFG